MNTTQSTTTNRYAGPCGRCGAKVPAETGLFVNENLGDGLIHRGAVHTTEADCKTSTKTWAQFTSRRRHVDHLAALDAVWTDHGGRRPVHTHVDAPSWGSLAGYGVVIAARGLYLPEERAFAAPRVKVTKDGMTIAEIDEPARPETGDPYADSLAAQQALVDAILEAVRS